MKKPIHNSLATFIFLIFNFFLCNGKEVKLNTFEILDIRLTATNEFSWYEFPVEAVFQHSTTKKEIHVRAFWDGGKSWIIRFSPTLAGKWKYTTVSTDSGLDKKVGTISVANPTHEQIRSNPNYHGKIQISTNGRYFEYSDGTPFFLLGDTNWAINTLRCGLGENRNGPFYQYLADRKSKEFTAIMMKHFRGSGDTEDANGQPNEGGYPFNTLESKKLNADFFKYLDIRMNEIWNAGLITAMPAAWFGKRRCLMNLDWAKKYSAYLMVRYGAFNGIFAIGGEYQYAFRDCGWDHDSYNQIGDLVQQYNSYKKPVSIHPSSNIRSFAPIHNNQSSSAYHNSRWLDHNWIQSGQQFGELFNIVGRTLELFALDPVKPVFLAEGYYEMHSDTNHVYHTRWQPWSAVLNGAAGYAYGAVGMWHFYDPTDLLAIETAKNAKQYHKNIINRSFPWYEELNFEGGTQMQFVRKLIDSYNWWKLKPCRAHLLVDGRENPIPTANDITPPHCASIAGELYVIYIPRENSGKKIALTEIQKGKFRIKWYNPRSGAYLNQQNIWVEKTVFTLPERPFPDTEDWVFVIESNK